MKKCYLDTNILINYKNEESPTFKDTQNLIKELIRNKYTLVVSPLIIDEFLYILQSILKKKSSSTLLAKILKDILNLPDITVVNPPLKKKSQLDVVKFMHKYKLQPRDAYHLLIMLSNKIKFFATFDKDFHKVFKEKVVSPVI